MADDGWTQWSNHVLKELERLNESQAALSLKLEDIQNRITILTNDKTEIDSLKAWKKDVDEVTSPTQLKELQVTVMQLERFKTTTIAVIVVLQALSTTAIAILAVIF